ncbi:hypothetical protein BC938DRAFT_479576 [Jimgerdemannia flammicorona]|uniref:Uncharacterized protein n=1 Tax=Jimgerdemannia flammicorona TaxID=994334 RepID=A0A433QKL9_9FUNG|nr:hypothetical protein BC938DRAFT_479576 [Jimgerdemannia flammicorona]
MMAGQGSREREYQNDVNSKNDDDWTPFHGAVAYGHIDVVELLTADVNAETKNDRTTFHEAAKYVHVEMRRFETQNEIG